MTTANKQYTEAVGRRKTAVARVRISESTKAQFTVNEKAMEEYFKSPSEKERCVEPLTASGDKKKFVISAHVKGGGIASQAYAIRLGLSRAIIDLDKDLRVTLKSKGLLTRDAREKERRKFGLKKARKSPQWSKR